MQDQIFSQEQVVNSQGLAKVQRTPKPIGRDAPVVWKPLGTQPLRSASKGTKTSGRDAGGHQHLGARTGPRPAPTRDEVERKAGTVCRTHATIGRVMRRSEAEDLKSQAIAAKAEEDGRTDSALRQDCYR